MATTPLPLRRWLAYLKLCRWPAACRPAPLPSDSRMRDCIELRSLAMRPHLRSRDAVRGQPKSLLPLAAQPAVLLEAQPLLKRSERLARRHDVPQKHGW